MNFLDPCKVEQCQFREPQVLVFSRFGSSDLGLAGDFRGLAWFGRAFAFPDIGQELFQVCHGRRCSSLGE